MRYAAIAGCVLLLAGSVRANPRDVGIKAPPIDLQHLLNAPPGTVATLESLRGQVIVLEFWGTWCSHCIKAIPHFNALADSMKGKPVQFIAVTYEDEPTVSKFLKTTPIHGWIGLNTTHSMPKAYGIETEDGGAWPLTVVIRPDGVVDARLRPYDMLPFPLAAANLQNLIDGKPSGLISARIRFSGDVTDSQGGPIPDALVRAIELTGPHAWREIGHATTDDGGHFRIDVEEPAAYFAANPNVLELSKDDYQTFRTNDLRPLPSTEPKPMRLQLHRT
jgi:thiol-disulfide isomerase/thioredoxin